MAIKRSVSKWDAAKRSALLIAMVLLAACAFSTAPTAAPGFQIATSTSAAERWDELFERTPYPFTTPLPSARNSPIDGTYIKVNPRQATPFPCRRCPDYAMEGGLWKLSFEKGIFRIIYSVNGWRSLGSFTVSGDRLTLFNDPNCIYDVGVYTWQVEEGRLILTEIDDICSIHLRAENLTHQPWLSCQPPGIVDLITGDWIAPAGCEE
jgi:hypothetical protein